MTLFLVLGAVGLVILIVTMVVGEVAEIGGHLDVPFLGDWFSTAGLAGFISALGFGGGIVYSLTGITWLSWLVGIGLGIAVAYGVGRLVLALRNSASDSLRTDSLLGATGQVISEVPASGFGEVRVSAAGQPMKLNACSVSGALPTGTEVWVSRVVSPTAVEVTPTEAHLTLPPNPES